MLRDTHRMSPPQERDQFVDRSAELAVLDQHRVMADEGRPSLVLLRGEAGVGKTRLLAEFTARLEGSLLSGSCLPIGERGLPLAPFVEAFRAMATDPSLRDLLPAGLDSLLFYGTEEPVEGLGSRSHLFQSVLNLIDDVARAATAVLIIEDLHWADQSTRDLIDFIVPNLRSQRLLMVASYRPDHVGRHHDLRPVVAELARHPHVTTLDVPPFSRHQVQAKLGHLLAEAPPDETIDRVLERTGGNAYFIEELVAADRIQGGDLPESLQELLLVRADGVSSMAQRLLRVASLVQVELEDWLLADVADEPLEVVRVALHEAVDARLLVTTGGRISFRHALLQEALRSDLLVGERAELHRAYARAVGGRLDTSRAGRAEQTAQLAFHAQQAGDTVAALRAWTEAASAAEAVFAFAEAHQHLDQALMVWDIVADAEELTGSTHVEVLARAGEDAFLGGAADDACRLVRLAIEGVSETDEPRLAGTLYERLGRSLSALGDRQGSMAAIERAVELVPDEPRRSTGLGYWPASPDS